MASRTGTGLARPLNALLAAGSLVGLSDAQLLERFLNGDEPQAGYAFSALVERHGPMVLGVCRRALSDPDDAADAFQATFLILVQRARSVRVEDSLGRWLHGVSRRVAFRARAQRVRRLRVQAELHLDPSVATTPDPTQALVQAEEAAALDHALARLPPSFRAALILCDLQGCTLNEAAQILHCPIGTVKSRLARGRFRLKELLKHRIVDARHPTWVTPMVPVSLIETTARAAVLAQTSPSLAAGLVPLTAWTLTQEVIRSMTFAPWKWMGALIATPCLAVTVVSSLAQQRSPEPTPTTRSSSPAVPGPKSNAAIEASVVRLRQLVDRVKSSPSTLSGTEFDQAVGDLEAALSQNQTGFGNPPAAAPPRELAKVSLPEYVVRPPDLLLIELASDPTNRPINGERLVRPDGRISLGFYGELEVAGLTTLQIKEKLIGHLLKTYSFSFEDLGLSRVDPATGQSVRIAPADSARVTVDIAAYNSQFYYVLGSVNVPGRFPITGQETVLDAIQHANGLRSSSLQVKTTLVRPQLNPSNHPPIALPVDLAAIIERGDTTTNYQLFPGDRLIVAVEPGKANDISSRRNEPTPNPQPIRAGRVEPRIPLDADPEPGNRIERRLRTLEQKLDALIQRLDRAPMS